VNPERWKKVREIFETASELPLEEQGAYTESECGTDAELLREVRGLLQAHGTAPRFLERPRQSDATQPPRAASLPERVGNYRISRLIAEGGMGTVYEAVQENPHRSVAVKVLRWGIFSPSVERRFRYEAEVLARLRHKNIAQIYEAGVAGIPSATPFFAMEYVEGSRDLLAYARENDLAGDERIRLAIQVAEAVHYGHQQGVIHRDLKPANVLVDRQGEPKIIDFGVARATDGAEQATRATQMGEIVGTPLYMSPEQFSGDRDGIDTRSDVYALGVLFFSLFCGSMPYDLTDRSVTEIARIVRESPPQNPRRAAPHLSREVEWILLKALEKERERRYGSASELAADLRRLLDNQAVVAGPPSKIYRLRKFVRRNRTLVASLVLISAAMVAGTVIATGGLVHASREASKFRSINDVLISTLVSVHADEDGRDVRVADLLDRAGREIESDLEHQPQVRAAMHHTLGQSYESLGLLEESIKHQSSALALWERRPKLDLERLNALHGLCSALIGLDRISEAEELLAEHAPDLPSGPPEARSAVLHLQELVFAAAYQRGALDEARSGLSNLLALCRAELGDTHATTLSIMMRLAQTHLRTAEYDKALALCDQLIEVHSASKGTESYEALAQLLQKAMILAAAGRLDDSQLLYERALEPYLALLGEGHPSAIQALVSYARLHLEMRAFAEAHALASDVARTSEEHLGPDHRLTLAARVSQAAALTLLGKGASSLKLQREIVATSRRVWGEEDARTAEREASLGQQLIGTGSFEEAEELLLGASRKLELAFGEGHLNTLHSLHALGFLYFRQAQYERARPFFERAVAGYESELGSEAELTVRALSNYATTLGRLEAYADAIEINLKLRKALFTTLSESDPQRVAILTNLGQLYELTGNLAQAEEVDRQALQFCQQNLPPSGADTLLVKESLAKVLRQRGEYEESVALFEELLETASLQRNAPSHRYMRFRYEYGLCLLELERLPEAEDQLTIAWELALAEFGETHEETRAIARKLVELYKLFEEPEAVDYWRALGGSEPTGD